MSAKFPTTVSLAVGAAAMAAIFCMSAFAPVVEAAGRGPFLVEANGFLPTNSRLVFQNPRGLQRYYAFFYYPGDLTWFYKYSVDGVVWSALQAGMDGALGSASLWVYDSGRELVVHLVASGTFVGQIQYRRGTIGDFAQTITWTGVQLVEPGGSNAATYGLSITRTANGRPVITAVGETFTSPTYRYEVRAWGANADSPTPLWTRATLIPSFTGLTTRQTGGYTSSYAAGGNYVFVAGSAARSLKSVSSPWDVSWVRASWDGTLWSVGPVTVLASTEAAARPASLVIDEALLPHALVLYSGAMITPLVHYRGTSPDGRTYQTFGVSSSPVTSATLSIDFTSNPKKLKAIYHYGSSNIYWKDSPTSTISWGPENTIIWSEDTTDLSSSQRDLVGRIHGLAESSHGVYYFNINI